MYGFMLHTLAGTLTQIDISKGSPADLPSQAKLVGYPNIHVICDRNGGKEEKRKRN